MQMKRRLLPKQLSLFKMLLLFLSEEKLHNTSYVIFLFWGKNFQFPIYFVQTALKPLTA